MKQRGQRLLEPNGGRRGPGQPGADPLDSGSGGARVLTGDLDNQGRLELAASASLTRSAGGV
ncbi:MAG: hypothetical protein FJY95_11070 [Candidatus Handelsmanbacteria bacterium]|nr:hypothetical protein [Candidatus Handelsmanbacteria bacterium]